MLKAKLVIRIRLVVANMLELVKAKKIWLIAAIRLVKAKRIKLIKV